MDVSAPVAELHAVGVSVPGHAPPHGHASFGQAQLLGHAQLHGHASPLDHVAAPAYLQQHDLIACSAPQRQRMFSSAN